MSTPIQSKRLLKEKRRLYEDQKEINELGIYIHWGDTVNNAKAMIVGPPGTPYEYGFFFYDIQFPDQYPIKPPSVKFCTGDGRVRFNPNLYVEGKVCLSILGTWSGPSWTSSLTTRTVLLSIQSLLNSHPIQNEPGHERELDTVNDLTYSEIIRYETINVGVVNMFENTPSGFEVFRDSMREIFLRKYTSYCETLETFSKKEGLTVRAPIWSFRTVYKAGKLLQKIEALRSDFIKGISSPVKENEERKESGGQIKRATIEDDDKYTGCKILKPN